MLLETLGVPLASPVSDASLATERLRLSKSFILEVGLLTQGCSHLRGPVGRAPHVFSWTRVKPYQGPPTIFWGKGPKVSGLPLSET